MSSQLKGIVHNAFFTINERQEGLGSLFGTAQGTDMDLIDYEIDDSGEVSFICKSKTDGAERSAL